MGYFPDLDKAITFLFVIAMVVGWLLIELVIWLLSFVTVSFNF